MSSRHPLSVDPAVANALLAAARTVLDPDFVATTLEDEGPSIQAEAIVLNR